MQMIECGAGDLELKADVDTKRHRSPQRDLDDLKRLLARSLKNYSEWEHSYKGGLGALKLGETLNNSRGISDLCIHCRSSNELYFDKISFDSDEYADKKGILLEKSDDHHFLTMIFKGERFYIDLAPCASLGRTLEDLKGFYDSTPWKREGVFEKDMAFLYCYGLETWYMLFKKSPSVFYRYTGDKWEEEISILISLAQNFYKPMNPETITIANRISPTLHIEDPAVIVEIVDIELLHNALALPSSPIAQGANPQASELAFRYWTVNTALLVQGITQASNHIGIYGWHHLSQDQALAIVYQHWHVIPWTVDIRAANVGLFARVLWMSGSGRGKAHLSIAPQVFS